VTDEPKWPELTSRRLPSPSKPLGLVCDDGAVAEVVPAVEWVSDVAPAAWIGPRLHRFCQDVGSVVPEGFEAYGRLLHPVETVEGGVVARERWSDVAARNGRIVHPEMQFHLVSRPVGEPAPARYERGQGPSWGSLSLPERRVLVELLAGDTATPDRCWFCVWEGYGELDDKGVTERVRLPARDYLLCTGPLDLALARLAWLSDQSPNLWWPDDRAWVVATEIDYAWTYTGGSHRLVDALLADARLEALPARLSDKPFYDSDLVNASLDRS